MKRKHGKTIRLSVMTVLSVTVASLVAVSICIAIFTTVYSRSLTDSAAVNSEQSVAQATAAMENRLSEMKRKLSAVCDAVYDSPTAADFEESLGALVRIEDDIFSVAVYGEDGRILSLVGDGVPKEAPLCDLSFNRTLFEGAAQGYAVSKPHVETLYEGVYPWVVTVARRTDRPVFRDGVYVAIDFRFSEIAEYMDKVSIGRHGYAYITDAAGNLVYHPQQQLIFSHLKEEDRAVAALPDGVHVGEDEIYSLQTTSAGTWRIVGVSYTDEFAAERRTQILLGIAVSLLCTAVVSVAVLFLYSRMVTAPVRELIGAMAAFENAAEKYTYTGGDEAVTELRVLSDSFRHMSERIRHLMEHVRNEEEELRRTELRALQAQINPHFLYNTLDSIQWMCEQGKTEDASKMVGALARLFRISISRGHELIPIGDELRHAENYLLIQSYRYKNQFTYRFDADESLKKYLCNKITIQPLIENAIYHGLDRMVDEGEIVISVKEAPDRAGDILITVSDNGVGMTEEQCRRVLEKGRSDSGGIGVKNVNDRLKIYFGPQYGLTLTSVPDEGTTVTVRIPKVLTEDEVMKRGGV